VYRRRRDSTNATGLPRPQ